MDSKNTKWTKRLDNLPKFSILQITDYVRSYGKTQQKTKALNFILMAILMTCLYLIKGQFSQQKLSVVAAYKQARNPTI